MSRARKVVEAPPAAVAPVEAAAAPLAAVDDVGGLRLVRLDRIQSSPSNPRKQFDEQGLAELAESIRSKGVLQPVLLRPRPLLPMSSADERAGEDGLIRIGMLQRRPDDGFELVAGERRVRAARLADLVVIPAIVRDYTDKEVLEVQVVENEQRQDVTPLEKADGYAALVERHQVSVEDLAARVGKSPATIRGLLKLRRLPASAREALQGGQLSAQTAQLIAQLASEVMREKCAGHVLNGRISYHHKDDPPPEPLSYRETKQLIQQRFMVELKQAPFSQKDATLTSAGACTTCPARCGNNREEWPDARADMCTHPECYQQKIDAWQQRAVAAAVEKGQTVLPATETKKVFGYAGQDLSSSAPYVDLKDQCWDDVRPPGKQCRSYKQLLEDHIEEKDHVLAFDEAGNLHRLVSKAKASEILKREHKIGSGSNGSAAGGSKEDPAERAKRMAESRLRRETDRAVLRVAAAAGESAAAGLPLTDPKLNELLKVLIRDQLYRCWVDHLDALNANHQVKAKGKAEQLAAWESGPLGQGVGYELFGLLVEATAANLLLGYGSEGTAKELKAACGIDRKSIEAETAKRLKAEAKGSKGQGPKRRVKEVVE